MNENNKVETKRVFFGFEVLAPFREENMPRSGRLLDPLHRHLTFEFLGNVETSKIDKILNDFPKPTFKIGKAGFFDKILLLPKKHPHVVSWHIEWLDDDESLINYQKECSNWFYSQGFNSKKDEFLPHVTICREPFNTIEWEKNFTSIPMIIKDLHLYESIGGLQYVPIWSFPMIAPFEEMDHTADIAFKISGKNMSELYAHAQTALAFIFPPILKFINKKNITSLEDIVMALNQIVSRADGEIGCPFKAVSFHGKIKEVNNQILEWEMIVDV